MKAGVNRALEIVLGMCHWPVVDRMVKSKIIKQEVEAPLNNPSNVKIDIWQHATGMHFDL
jgi:hypothetical protein